jgi:Secretion system C-terminal sorting domain
MKTYLYFFFVLSALPCFAQQPYFVDTLNTHPSYTVPAMSNVFELPNNTGYAVCNFKNYDCHVTYTNQYGRRTGQKNFNVFDTLIFTMRIHSSATLLDGSHIIAGVTAAPSQDYSTVEGGLVAFKPDMSDTLWTRKYRYIQQGISLPLYFLQIKRASDGTLWILADALPLSFTYARPVILHLTSTGNIISQQHYVPNTHEVSPSSLFLLPTKDGGCIFSNLDATLGLGWTGYQAGFLKVRADGSQEWYKQFGIAGGSDNPLFVAEAAQPKEYWLFYRAALDTLLNGKNLLRAVRVDSTGATLATKDFLLAKPPYTTIQSVYDMHQYPNGDILISMRHADPPNNVGCLYKFKNNNNLDSLWRKSLPVPHYYNGRETGCAYDILPAANGDIICGGYYSNIDLANDNMYITRVDSTGEFPSVNTTATPPPLENLISVFPNPTTGTLHLTHSQGTTLKSYTIADISGRIIERNTLPSSGGAGGGSLHLDLPNGVYFLLINDINGQTSRHKVVILR